MARKRPHKTIVFSLILLLMPFAACYNPKNYDDERRFVVAIHGKTVEIIGYNSANINIKIPPRIRGLRVTAIGNEAFRTSSLSNKELIASVKIPRGVTVIGEKAFHWNALKEIIIPDTVVSIGDDAFAYNKLTGVHIPRNVKYIGSRAFLDNRLEYVTMPRTVAQIGSYAFAFNNITEVVLPDRITEIGSGMFWNNNLTGIKIPEGVTTIGDNAFENNGLTELVLPKSVISIGRNAFSFNHTDVHGAYNDRNKMSRVTIGDNVELDMGAIRDFTMFYNYAVMKRGGTYAYHGYYWMPEDKSIPVYRFDPDDGWKSPDIAFLPDMPDLEDVRLRNNDALTDIAPLSELKKIKTLHIDNCPNIENIQPLAALGTLEWLRIDGFPNIQNIQPLASLAALKFLYLIHNNNYDYGDIAPLEKLESVTIRGDHAGEIDLDSIGQLRYVKRLSLSSPTIKNINALRNLTNLETLDISGADHLDFSWAVHLRNLTKLELNFCSVEDISPLAKAPNLAEIDLAGSSIKDIAPLLNSNSIKHIRVFDEDVTAGISDNLRSRFDRKGIYLDTSHGKE